MPLTDNCVAVRVHISEFFVHILFGHRPLCDSWWGTESREHSKSKIVPWIYFKLPSYIVHVTGSQTVGHQIITFSECAKQKVTAIVLVSRSTCFNVQIVHYPVGYAFSLFIVDGFYDLGGK